ncbi:MAG: oxygen-dependent coproporphyrinogen oxidase [Proteobacteria bacterium]|nr:oxygen-dependent coproporphyrinogen oxidase [Pseudomonadota bacterium]
MNEHDAAPLEPAFPDAPAWFAGLRDRICTAFEKLEDALSGTNADQPAGRFTRKAWEREGGGGGTMAVMKGRVFEKVGVNVSTVWGTFSEKFRAEIPGAAEDGRFWAAGISLVAHMHSPLVPAVHMNTRHIATPGRTWFGGGADLNPPIPDQRDTDDFHAALKACCERHACADHEKFRAWADDYFYIKHRERARGVGGIFYDYIAADETSLAFTRDVGETFLSVYPELVARHMDRPWDAEQRKAQLAYRGLYAEFNLVYDRGTRFGLMTGGNPEAVLVSLPPVAEWP